MENETIIVEVEAAKAEFDRFIECMDLDVDTSVMDTEDVTAFEKQKRRILRAIGNGSLVINDEGEAVYTPSNPNSKHHEPLTFHETTGASLMEMDGKKKNHSIAQTFAVMGAMCKVHPNVISGLAGIDAKICMALFSLLMD